MATTRTKYFKGAEPNLTAFELFCKAHGLDQSEVINDLVAKFLRENEGQETLDAYPKEPDHTHAIFEKAALVAARSELARALDVIERNLDRKELFQLDLVKALRVIEPIYNKTKDTELRELLKRTETYLR
jgi:DNA-directed RNA polymerase subunit F